MNNLFKKLLVVWLALWAASALAQGAPDPSVYLANAGDNDQAVMTFKHLVGDFFSNPLGSFGGATTLVGTLFLVFNSFVFVCAVIWMSYGILVGIVTSAHEGEVLGKKLSAVWLPIRYVIGIAGIVPVFGGFSLAQVLLVGTALLGIGVTNLGLNQVLAASSSFQGLLSPSVAVAANGAAFRDAANALFVMQVCRITKQATETEAAGTTAERSVIRRYTPADAKTLEGEMWGLPGSPNACGGVTVLAKDTTRQDSSALAFRTNSVNYDAIAEHVQNGYRSNYAAFSQRIATLAAEWLQARNQALTSGPGSVPPVPLDAIRAAADAYATAVHTATLGADADAKAQEGAITAGAIENMKSTGWFGLGSWYSTFAEVNAALADASRSVEVKLADPAVADLNDSRTWDAVSAANKGFVEAVAAKSGGTGMAPSTEEEVFAEICSAMGISYSATATGNCSIGQGIVSGVMQSAASNSGGQGLINPIIMFKNMGDYTMVAGEMMLASGAVLGMAADVMEPKKDDGLLASGVKAVADKAGIFSTLWKGMKAGLKKLAVFLPILGTILFILGALMAIYIPLIPFITWMGGLIQYVVVVMEGLVGMPVAALAHMETEGEGLGARTEKGYIFLLNVAFRPILMTFGFFAASALVIALGTFQALLFLPAMANAQGNSITGIGSIIGFLVVFFVLNVTLIQGLFNMIFLLPDQVLGLIGNSSTSPIGKETEDKVHRLFMGGANITHQVAAPARALREGAQKGAVPAVPGRNPTSAKASVRQSN